ncbi:MAG: tRNA pseudouridine synthase A [Thermoplasmatota archaeon]
MRHTLAVRFAYDGTAFDAYAKDPGLPSTVEGTLQKALGRLGYVGGSWRTGSRTDAGVSALENVARCTLERPYLKGLVPAVNSHLPVGVWVTGFARVPDDWKPRYNALRTYEYLAADRGEELEALAAACALFVGTHDMTSFARVEPPRDPVRHIHRFDVEGTNGGWRFTVTSPGYLWNQVRRMVAATIAVAQGKATLADIEAALGGAPPPAKARMVPAEGLLLKRVDYGDALDWLPEAGRVGPERVVRGWQAAKTRAAVAAHVAGLTAPER